MTARSRAPDPSRSRGPTLTHSARRILRGTGLGSRVGVRQNAFRRLDIRGSEDSPTEERARLRFEKASRIPPRRCPEPTIAAPVTASDHEHSSRFGPRCSEEQRLPYPTRLTDFCNRPTPRALEHRPILERPSAYGLSESALPSFRPAFPFRFPRRARMRLTTHPQLPPPPSPKPILRVFAAARAARVPLAVVLRAALGGETSDAPVETRRAPFAEALEPNVNPRPLLVRPRQRSEKAHGPRHLPSSSVERTFRPCDPPPCLRLCRRRRASNAASRGPALARPC
jgi:hypothetical protein